MKSVSFRKDLVGVQDELLRFAYKLTTDREEANDLLQETSFPAVIKAPEKMNFHKHIPNNQKLKLP